MAGSSKKAKQARPAETKASSAKAAKAAGPVEDTATAKAACAPARPDSFCLSLAQKRKLAKDAMWASLAVLTVTAFTGARKRGPSRTLHIASGAALIGLALWHHTLYGANKAARCPAPAL